MATYRNQSQGAYSIGSAPPTIKWTLVRGDTAAFGVYVTDDNKTPLTISEWTINMEIKRPNTSPGDFTDDADTILSLVPVSSQTDEVGEFTVGLTANQSYLLETGDIFDIELSDATRVWTVARGTLVVIEDVTNSES